MPFGRTGRQHNRSQHDLVDTVGPAASLASADGGSAAARAGNAAAGNTPLSASSNAAFSSNESFDSTQQPPQSQSQSQSQPQLQSQPPHPPPHTVSLYTSPQGGVNTASVSPLHHSNTVSAAFNPRQKDPDFADQVSRSQSHRFSQVSPIQNQHPHHQYSPSGSVNNLQNVPLVTSPVAVQGQPVAPPHQPQAQPPKKRNFIKNILSGNNNSNNSNRGPDPHQHVSQNSYNNTAGLARRPSKRVSNPPPIRTGASQVSLEQPSVDWQSQGPPSRGSPLQGVGELQDSYLVNESNQQLRLQNPQDIQQHNTPTTIRQVAADVDPPSYGSSGELAYLGQHGHIQLLQGQTPTELQQHQYNQVVFDPSQQQQQQQQYQFASPQQVQYRSGVHLGSSQHQNPETVSQQSHESPIADSDQHSTTGAQPAQVSPAVNYSPQNEISSPGQNMPPPTQPHSRRSQETDKPPPGPPPSYRHNQQPQNMSNLPPPPAVPQQSNYRQTSGSERQQFEGQGVEQGRNSPQPPTSDRGETDEKAFKDLLSKYKNVKRLYFDGKKDIEQLTLQIEQLQNALAKQRMSQSRTALDDSEYITRFNRLNGAINNLSFNIRKDWVTLPSWLAPYVSSDAVKTGKQEMTAIGRAVITRWVMEEIFNSCFHPGLDPELSRELKRIEHNIRHFSYTMSSQEEYLALTGKVVSWRMATLEGLADVLRSPGSADHKADFTRHATSNLTACLFQHLADPPPPGVDGSASMIVELAVAIASSLPLESRDVAITYPLPEQPIQPETMEVEKAGLPPLDGRPSEAGEEGAGEEGGKDGGSKDGRDRRADKARSAAPPAPPHKDPGRVRFAGFVGVEVRGRQVLIKAPVWTLA